LFDFPAHFRSELTLGTPVTEANRFWAAHEFSRAIGNAGVGNEILIQELTLADHQWLSALFCNTRRCLQDSAAFAQVP